MASKAPGERHCNYRDQLSVGRKGAGLQIMLFLLSGQPWFPIVRSDTGCLKVAWARLPMESRASALVPRDG